MQRRRLLFLGVSLSLLIAALFFVPAALGWRTATVDSYTAGTFYPQTVTASSALPAPLLSCEQTSGTTIAFAQINIDKNINNESHSYFSCTNNWGTDVTFAISVFDAGGTGISVSGSRTIAPGQTKCITTTFNTGSSNGGNVIYRVTATATDLSAALQFAGEFRTPGTNSAECSLP